MIKTLALLAVASGGCIINITEWTSKGCTGQHYLPSLFETGKCIEQNRTKSGKSTSAFSNVTSCTSKGDITIFDGPICAGAVISVLPSQKTKPGVDAFPAGVVDREESPAPTIQAIMFPFEKQEAPESTKYQVPWQKQMTHSQRRATGMQRDRDRF
jgi:hypothetical protein